MCASLKQSSESQDATLSKNGLDALGNCASSAGRYLSDRSSEGPAGRSSSVCLAMGPEKLLYGILKQ